jgi:peptidoglycan hydrolase-like protein with peptidoglycan-binding domain
MVVAGMGSAGDLKNITRACAVHVRPTLTRYGSNGDMDMRRTISLILLALVGLAPSAQAEDARSILETMQQKQLKRWSGVDDYLVRLAIMGNSTQMYFQRTEVTGEDGVKQTLFLPISGNQRTSGTCSSGAVQMTPEALEAYAQGAEMVGAGVGEEFDKGLEQAGLPRGLLSGGSSDSTVSADPRVMMGNGATFARAAADAKRYQAQEGARNAADAEQQADQMVQFMNTARLVGTETIDGRSAFHLKSDEIDVQQTDGEAEYTMDAMSIWIDTQEYVPLRMKIDGTMTSAGETRPMTIESLMTDYRTVPGSSMYESYKQTMKISGMMDAAQEAEMRDAVKQLEDLDKQMAEMPANQRAMMENMMGPQLEAMRSMAAGGGFQTQTVVQSIQVNPPMVAEDGSPCPSGSTAQVVSQTVEVAPSSASTAQISQQNMTKMVQQDLTKLGYDPGPVDGKAGTATVIAISKFQAENGMEVTGTVTPQLAGVLSAKASGTAAPAAPAPARDPAALKAAQQACLEEKVAAAQEAQKTKRGFGRLVSGISRAASRFGGSDVASQISKTSQDVYTVDATSADFAAAAKDLGLTEDDVAACQNPL